MNDINNSSGKSKYAFVGKSGFDTKLVKGQGYWVYANESGNLTIPNSGGSLSNESYSLSDLMFRNSSGSELNVSDAWNQSWIGLPEDTDVNALFRYWNSNYLNPDTEEITGRFEAIGADRPSKTVNSWEGLFVYGLKDNIRVLRQN